jgi:hypothetical protein
VLFNVYIDGSWLFKQCGANGILSSRMEYPDNAFHLDFRKLLACLASTLGGETGQPVDPSNLYFYTAIFEIPDQANPEWGDIGWLRNSTAARMRFAQSATDAGFDPDGTYHVPLRTWMLEKLRDRRYQEKMVDTSVVARTVQQVIADPNRLHVIISGDLDMLPAISTVVPQYTDSVVLATTHPDQYNPGEAQSSFKLNLFDFKYGPVYLEVEY